MIKKIRLQNFRNYEALDLDLERGNILIGKNAQGKTNILEAINFLSSTKSFRVTKDTYLIDKREDFSIVEGLFEDESVLRIVLEKTQLSTKKTIQQNGVKVSAKKSLGTFVSVVFSPEDVSFIKDSPSVRRRYLDIVLCQADKEYLNSLIKYKKILEQRNSLLKAIRENRTSPNQLEVWNEKLVAEGILLIKKRIAYLKYVNEFLPELYKKIAGIEEKIEVQYAGSIRITPEDEVEQDFFKKLKEFERADIAAGVTNYGPHRDDMLFLKNEQDAALYGSRGEFRSIVLALKFGEGAFLEKSLKKKVMYLLDDVFSELDKIRRDNLYLLIKDNPFLITTTDLDHIGNDLQKISKIYKVKEGFIESV